MDDKLTAFTDVEELAGWVADGINEAFRRIDMASHAYHVLEVERLKASPYFSLAPRSLAAVVQEALDAMGVR